jgi:hypothetical protein
MDVLVVAEIRRAGPERRYFPLPEDQYREVSKS